MNVYYLLVIKVTFPRVTSDLIAKFSRKKLDRIIFE